MHLTKGETKFGNALNAITDTLNSAIGYAENLNDFGINIITNGIANGAGYIAGYLPGGRALGVAGRKALTQGVNYITNKAKDMFLQKK